MIVAEGQILFDLEFDRRSAVIDQELPWRFNKRSDLKPPAEE